MAKVLSLTTHVDSTREAVVKELESAVAIAEKYPAFEPEPTPDGEGDDR